MKTKKFEVKKYEDLIEWFETVYQGRPIEIELMNKNGTYRATIVFYKEKDLTNQYLLKKAKMLTAD